MAKSTKKPRALGRGLSALMADVETSHTSKPEADKNVGQREVAIDLISPNPDQPRRSFDKEDLQDLASSIEKHGVVQPLLVREIKKKSGTFEIIAGERRWRAAQIAQLHTVPVVVRKFTDQEVLEVAIIENVQREDLNPIEEAMGYDQLMTRFGHTQQEVSDAMGKSRSHIANLLRLLNLPKQVREMVSNGSLSSGHARALLSAEDPIQIAKEVVRRGLSVRQVETLMKQNKGSGATRPKGSTSQSKKQKDADTKALENELSAHLKMKVSIDFVSEEAGGKMTINFHNLEQLDDLMNSLSN